MEHQSVKQLREAYKKHRFRFSVLPERTGLKEHSLREIRISNPEVDLVFLVDDEYEDVDDANPLVLLHLIIISLEDYEDTDDYLEWLHEIGVHNSTDILRQCWFDLRDNVPKLRAVIGDLETLSTWDWSINTSYATELREARL